jgi:hypothetical protein
MSAEINAAHDRILLQCAAAIVDVTSMQPQVLTLWREDISMMLPESPADDAEDISLEGTGSHPPPSRRWLTHSQACYKRRFPS